jgi:hypothetical protein
LAEVLMALCYRGGGLAGVVTLFSLALALTFAILFRMLLRDSEDVLLCGAIAVLALLSSAIHWLACPHLFSLLLTVVCYDVLEQYQRRRRDRLWLLPAIMLLWVNLHGGYILGIFLVAVYLCGNAALWLSERSGRREFSRLATKKMAFVLLCSLGAAIVNPSGIAILWFPFSLMADPFVMGYASEYLSPDFHRPLPFKYYLLMLIVLLGVARLRIGLIEVVLILVLTYMALYSARYIPLFAVIMAPISVRLLHAQLRDFDFAAVRLLRARAANFLKVDRALKGHLWPCLVTFLVGTQALSGNLRFEIDPNLYPIAAVEFLQREKIDGNMFNNDEFGDYLVFAAWPRYRVFVDSRSDMYGATWLKQYLKIVNLESDWRQTLDQNKITWLFLRSDSALCALLAEHRDWQVVYADRIATIIVKKIDAYRALIEKYPDVKPWAAQKTAAAATVSETS